MKNRNRIIINGILFLISLCCIVPFFLLIAASFTDEMTLVRYGYSFIPKKFSLDAYTYLFKSSEKILRAYATTIFVTVVGLLGSLTLTTLLAYPLSRKDLPYRNVISFLVFFTMLFNGGLVAFYMLWARVLNIKNTVWALIVPALMMNAFYVMMMRTYFSSNIPVELIEAVKIDGGSELKILTQVILPMSKPIMATVGLMTGLGYWNDWKNGLYFITDTTKFSIQNVLNSMLMDAKFLQANMDVFSGTGGMSIPTNSLKMAIAVIGAVPVLIVYPFFQKYFVKGITIGAVKG